MKKNGRQIVVIGLGHFGASIARALARHSAVLALDIDIQRVNAIAEDVQRTLCLDARDFGALSSVVSSEFDEAVVSIGESLEASILATLHLKRLGVPVIRAKANSSDHAEILKSVGAEHIVFPEYETAERLAMQVLNPNLLDYIPLAKDYRVMDLAAPEAFHGHDLVSLQIRNRFELFIIAIKKDEGSTFVFLPGPKQVIEPGDVLVLIGREEDILRLHDAPPVPAPRDPPTTPPLKEAQPSEQQQAPASKPPKKPEG